MSVTLLPVYIVIFMFGAVIGSFLNVCIYRIPKKESIVVVPSHCMSCGYHLRWFDLIPIFSWLFLGGRCRKCGEKISIQYPLIEGCNGILYVWIFAGNDLDVKFSILSCLLASALLVLSIIDLRTFEIPLGINIFILVLGVIHLCFDWEHWYEYIIGFFAVSLILEIILLLSKGRAIGGGDVKLMATAGLFLGWKQILFAFCIGCIVGAVIHLIRMKVSNAEKVLAMGPYLSIGIFIMLLYGQELMMWYLGLFAV